MKQLCISVRQARELLSIGRTSIYALIKNGHLESIKIGSKRLILLESVEELIGSSKQGGE